MPPTTSSLTMISTDVLSFSPVQLPGDRKDEDPSAALRRIVMRFRIDTAMLREGIAEETSLAKCVWRDEKLSRWTPSGCATLFGERDGDWVWCEANHATEFGVLLFDTYQIQEDALSSESRKTSPKSGSSIVATHNRVLLFAALFSCTMLVTLGIAVLEHHRNGHETRQQRRVRVHGFAFSTTTRRHNASVLLTLLMISLTLNILAALIEEPTPVFLIGVHDSMLPILAPLLIASRFFLFCFFTILVMKPLESICSMTTTTGSTATHSSSIRVLKWTRVAMKLGNLFVPLSVCMLIVYGEAKFASLFVGVTSYFVSLIYTSVAYQCATVLAQYGGQPSHANATTSSPPSYEAIGAFLFRLSLLYSFGHILQGTLYFLSVLSRGVYLRYFFELQMLFKTAELCNIWASLVYAWRTTRMASKHATWLSKPSPGGQHTIIQIASPELMFSPAPPVNFNASSSFAHLGIQRDQFDGSMSSHSNNGSYRYPSPAANNNSTAMWDIGIGTLTNRSAILRDQSSLDNTHQSNNNESHLQRH